MGSVVAERPHWLTPVQKKNSRVLQEGAAVQIARNCRKVLMQFNKEQREGLAKVADNLATACMIAAIVGGLIGKKIGWDVAIALFVIFLMLIFASLKLRKGEDNGN